MSESAVTVPMLLSRTSLTRRQIHYWITSKRLRTLDVKRPGSGNEYRLPASELLVVQKVEQLLQAGFSLNAAFDIAHAALMSEDHNVQLPNGIRLTFGDEK